MNLPSDSERDQRGDVEYVIDQVFRLVRNNDRAGVARVLAGPRPADPCGQPAGRVIGTVTGPLAEVHQSLCVRPLHPVTAYSPDWLRELHATIHQLNDDIQAGTPFLSSAGGYVPLSKLPRRVALEVIGEVVELQGDGRVRLLAADESEFTSPSR